jgi:hypothetical protein
MSSLNIKFNHHEQIIRSRLSITLIFTYLLIIGTISRVLRAFLIIEESNFTKEQEYLAVVMFIVSIYFLITSFVSFYAFTLNSIKLRFDMINDNLHENRVRLFAELHELLCGVTKKINEVMAVPLELFLIFALFCLTFSLYEIYFAVANGGRNMAQLGLCILTNTWCVFD